MDCVFSFDMVNKFSIIHISGGTFMRFCHIASIIGIGMGCLLSDANAAMTEKTKELMTVRFSLQENQRATEPYKIRYKDRNFIVYPNVFSPKYFPDTFWFEQNLKIQPEDSFLEIGSGTGLISVMAAIKGAGKVTAVDINPAAVKNTTENVFLNHVSPKFRILEGDVFEPIPAGQKFDVIFWFAPFMHVNADKSSLTDLEKAVFDPNYVSLKKYLSGARHYLSQRGKLYLGYSPTHGDMDVLETLAKEYGWSVSVVAREEEQLPVYPGVDQVDFITVMLIELKPLQSVSKQEANSTPEPAAYQPPVYYQQPVVEYVYPTRPARKFRRTTGMH